MPETSPQRQVHHWKCHMCGSVWDYLHSVACSNCQHKRCTLCTPLSYRAAVNVFPTLETAEAASRGARQPVYGPEYWQCCQCRGGPQLYVNTKKCQSVFTNMICGHIICSDCKIDKDIPPPLSSALSLEVIERSGDEDRPATATSRLDLPDIRAHVPKPKLIAHENSNSSIQDQLANTTSVWTVHICSKDNILPLSMMENFQNRIEFILGARVVWWPLKQPRKKLRDGFARVLLNSDRHNIKTLEIDVPTGLAHRLSEQTGIIKAAPGSSILPTHTSPRTISSATDQVVPSSTGTSAQGRGNSPPVQKRNNARTIQQLSNNRSAVGQDEADLEFLHWCVEDLKSNMILVEVMVKELSNLTFARRLLAEFRKVRGPWEWLTLSTCGGAELVKFQRVEASRKILGGLQRAIPEKDNDEYKYDIHEPEALFMDSVEKLLQHRFTEKDWCRCVINCICENVLQLIPKKVNGKLRDEAWVEGYGLKAITAWSFSRTVTAFLILQVPPIAFAIRWLIGHPGDLQNAFFLECLLIGLLNIFVVFPDRKLIDKYV